MDDSGFDSDVRLSSIPEDRPNNSDFHLSDSSLNNSPTSSPKRNLKSSNAIFQQKLGRRIAQSKLQNIDKITHSDNLIPIQRLTVPNNRLETGANNSSNERHTTTEIVRREKHPLVSWASSDSEEEINFFALAANKDSKQILTDTFSIHELPLSESGDEDDDDDLGLLPPSPVHIRPDNCCFRINKYINRSIL